MKKLTARVLTVLLLILGTLFATSFNFTPTFAVTVNNPTSETPSGETPETPTPSETEDDDAPAITPAEETPEETPAAETPQSPNPPPEATPEGTPETTPDATTPTTTSTSATDPSTCQDQTGSLSWLVCPSSGVIARIVDALYSAIEDLLVVQPISMDTSSPIYLVWQYTRGLTNTIFIIFLLIVIYSQLTSIGLNNYGVKRVLPRLIIAVILVNLSFIICSLAVDVSNIVGSSLRDFFGGIETSIIENATVTTSVTDFSFGAILTTVLSGGAIVGVAAGAIGGAKYLFFMLLTVLIGALIAVVSGLITIAARQAVVALLIMIAPLAFVSYLLPNTEKWFAKWKDLLVKMLIFYPMFSFLFGASELIGYALIASANSDFGVILGLGVQIFPLFFSWSLMKMSGTILGSLNNGIRRLSAPIQHGATGWSLSHAEQARQHYFANSTAPGAKLRRYLDYRRELRESDTRNSVLIRKGKAIESSLKTSSSSLGRDASGNLAYRRRANRYTSNAKRASLYGTRTSTAVAAHKNTLSGYGTYFSHSVGDDASRLASAHAEAYKDAMQQQYLTANEAEADQKWLLDQYLNAITTKDKDPYEYNRLIGSAAGGLGHLGEASIMGQVIVGNSSIENRRRAEARIMMTKFGVKKPEFRAMVFDKEFINDNGIATDIDGNELENDQYQLKPGVVARPWQKYIYVNKDTNAHITKDAYANLSPADQSRYRRVRYMDITNDNGNTVQRVYEDDAGYMKEMLADDIAIGDPINKRYLTTIGVAHADNETTGALRKYHSTVTSAILNSRYKEHNGAFTPMLTAQTNMGYVTTPGQLNIAELQSLNVATKPGPLLQNDATFLKNWASILSTLTDQPIDPKKDFSYYFPDDDIMNYRNVNGNPLKGLRQAKDKNGNPYWDEVTYADMREMSDEEILEARKNYIKHNILTKTAKKLIGVSNRRLSPSILENQKPDTLEALAGLASMLQTLGLANVDDNVPFEKKLDGSLDKNGNKIDLFETNDPSVLQNIINEAKRIIEQKKNGEEPTPSDTTSGTSRSRHSNPSQPFSNDLLRLLATQLNRYADAEEIRHNSHDTTAIINHIDDLIGDNYTGLAAAIDFLQTVLDQMDPTDPRYSDLSQIVVEYQVMPPSIDTAEDLDRKESFLRRIHDYLTNFGYDD